MSHASSFAERLACGGVLLGSGVLHPFLAERAGSLNLHQKTSAPRLNLLFGWLIILGGAREAQNSYLEQTPSNCHDGIFWGTIVLTLPKAMSQEDDLLAWIPETAAPQRMVGLNS
eukprot:scaffold8831_cov18-Tisochrysis_lutea.AAC.1